MKNFFKKQYVVENNIIKFHIDDKTVKENIDFYTEAPFPDYGDNEDKFSINYKGQKNYLTREFKKFVGFNQNILEVGCGTGQLSIYLSIGTNNRIFALDPALTSINLGKIFSIKNKIQNVKFVNADIFDDVFQEKTFDFIWTNGVLHHTKNPKLGFNIICNYLKKDGYILLGLYNKFGRLRTVFRRLLYKIFGKKIIMFLDPTLRNIKKENTKQIKSWIRDQYEHPLESLHTLDEVLDWFNKNDIEFINSIPKCDLSIDEEKLIFEKNSTGNYLARLFSQLYMIFNNLGSNGGLFVVIGKKKQK